MAHKDGDSGDSGPGGSDDRGTRRANPIDQHVGNRVRMRRMILGMSQEKLGEALGLTFQQVQKYEKGSNRIGASRLHDIARILAVPVQYFYEDAPMAHAGGVDQPGLAEKPAENYVVDFLSTREGLELNKAFGRIADARVRKAVVDLVKSLGPETSD